MSVNDTTYFWNVRKLRQYLRLRAFSIVIYESSIPTNQYFFWAIFVWSVNYEILVIYIYVDSAYVTGYLPHFYIKYICLIQKKEFSSSAILLAIFCWLINCTSWMSWNYASYFSYVQRIKHCLCLRPFSVFIQEKLSSNYYLSF